MTDVPHRGRAFVGTSGFSYADWAPRFYPSGLKAAALLPHYAGRLAAVELNNTFYQSPSAEKVAGWVAATPPGFRFAVKAQRGGAWRATRAADPSESVAWLTAPYRHFGERLGPVLLRMDASVARDDAALERLLDAWPRDIPVAFELQHPSWEMDEVHALLRAAGAALVATDVDEQDEPVLRRMGGLLYLRLRRSVITETDVAAWAARLDPFLADGLDAWVFLRHDADGANALLAERLDWMLSKERPASAEEAAP